MVIPIPILCFLICLFSENWFWFGSDLHLVTKKLRKTKEMLKTFYVVLNWRTHFTTPNR